MRIAVILGAAFILDLVLGDPNSAWHPICLIGNLISHLEKGLRKLFPKSEKGELAAGLLLVLLTVTISTALPAVLLFFCYRLHFAAGLIVESLLAWLTLAARSLKDASMKVCDALEKGDVEEARTAVSMIVGRDTSRLDEAGIARAAIETVAENSSDGVIAPMLFLALFGAPGACFYKAVNTMDSMVGYTHRKYLYFGRAAARLDDLLNFLPSRLSGLLMIAAAFLTGKDGAGALRIFLRDRKKHASPNSAQTEAACAGALGIRLAGDAWYFGELHKKEYIGDDTRPVRPSDIRSANLLMYTATVLCLLICIGVRLLIWRVRMI